MQNFDTGEQYGFGAAKGNTALIKLANYVIPKSLSGRHLRRELQEVDRGRPAG